MDPRRSTATDSSSPTDRPATIAVDVPGVVVLVGAAGVGKSTFAAAHFDPAEILSSDALRGAVSGDEADQRATKLAFSILHREVRRRLAAGRLVVVDATNVERHARLALVRLARGHGVPIIAVVLRADRATVHARNASRRHRVVPAEIVDRHLAALGRLGADGTAIAATLGLEGFAAVHLVDDLGPPAAIERRQTGPT